MVQDSASNLDDLVQNILKLNDKLDHVVSDPFLPSVRHPDDVKELQDLVQS